MTANRDQSPSVNERFTSPDDQVAADALAELLTEHRVVLRAICHRFTGGRSHDAEDLYQDFCEKLLKIRTRFDPERDWLAWTRTVLENLARDQIGKRKTKEKHIKSAPHQVDTARDAKHAPQQQALINAMKLDVDECVKGMTDKLQQILVLRELHGLTLQTIATKFGLSGPSQARKWCEKARNALRKCLQEKGWTAQDLEDN